MTDPPRPPAPLDSDATPAPAAGAESNAKSSTAERGSSPAAVIGLTFVVWIGSEILGFLVALPLHAIGTWILAVARHAPVAAGGVRAALRDPILNVLMLWTIPICAVALLRALTRREPGGWRRRLGIVRGLLPIREYPLAVLSVIAAAMIGTVVETWLQSAGWLPPHNRLRTEAWAVFRTGPPLVRLAAVVAGSVLVACQEEMMLRGYLQRGLLVRWHPFAALSLTALLFAALHLDVAFSSAVIPSAILFGVFAWRTRSIVPGICAHFALNGTSGITVRMLDSLVVLQGRTDPSPLFGPPSTVRAVIALVLCLAVVAAGVVRLERVVRRREVAAG